MSTYTKEEEKRICLNFESAMESLDELVRGYIRESKTEKNKRRRKRKQLAKR